MPLHVLLERKEFIGCINCLTYSEVVSRNDGMETKSITYEEYRTLQRTLGFDLSTDEELDYLCVEEFDQEVIELRSLLTEPRGRDKVCALLCLLAISIVGTFAIILYQLTPIQ